MGALHQDSASLRREKLKLFLLFNFNGYTRKTSIKQLVAKYFVGKNSIVADLNTIKPQLMEYQLQLIRDKDGTQIKGRRKNIKTAILDSFHRFQKELLFDNLAEFQTDNPLDKIIFDNHLKEVVLILIEEMQKDYGFQFDRDFKYSFLINLMVDIKFSGIMRIVGSVEVKKLGSSRWSWLLGVGVLEAVIGFATLFNPVLAVIGITAIIVILFLMEGIATIALAFHK